MVLYYSQSRWHYYEVLVGRIVIEVDWVSILYQGRFNACLRVFQFCLAIWPSVFSSLMTCRHIEVVYPFLRTIKWFYQSTWLLFRLGLVWIGWGYGVMVFYILVQILTARLSVLGWGRKLYYLEKNTNPDNFFRLGSAGSE